MGLKHDDGWSMPTDDSFYPPLPAIYKNVSFQYVFFYADPTAVQKFLPSPLKAAEDGLCVGTGMAVPVCINYGPFEESFIVLKCHFRNQTGFYCSHVFHNGPAGIAAGREIYGTPKIYAELKVSKSDQSMATKTSLGGVPVLNIDSTMSTVPLNKQMPSLNPSWRLKIIPKADGPGPAIKQLIDCSKTTQNLEIYDIATGHGKSTFGASPQCDLTKLSPLAYGNAFYVKCSYIESYAEIAYDYLGDDT